MSLFEDTQFKNLVDKADNYANTSFELFKLKAIEKVGYLFSKIILSLILLLFFVLISILISIGISLWLGSLLKEVYWGFFVVGIGHIFIALLIYRFRNQIIGAQTAKLLLSVFDFNKSI